MEVLIVVLLVGILATLSSYGVRRYVLTSKSAEALQNLGGMARAVRAAAARDTMSGTLLGANTTAASAGSTTGSSSNGGNGKSGNGKSGNGNSGSNGATVTHNVAGLCDSAEPVPSSMNSVKGTKYQASSAPGADYNSGDRYTGWRCLQFSVPSPQLYQYRYETGGAPVQVTLPKGGTPPGLDKENTWTASAQGDLDGDGKTSWFVLEGYITDAREVMQAPGIGQQDPEE